jgi:putative restriction endonuclease
MIKGKPWSRDETILAINLYCRIPFGRQHSRTPEVIELAKAIGRTPGSVAMKLNNITSIDPEEQTRGVKGLSKSSKLDKIVWDEFHNNWQEMAAESETLWQDIVTNNKASDAENKSQEQIENNNLDADFEGDIQRGPTEGIRSTKVRLAQSFFRQTVLSSYLSRCCISDIPIPQFLIASHIMSWSDFPDHRINPSNGLCLSRLHDAAFDKGFICFDERYLLVLSKRLKEYIPNESLNVNFIAYEGNPLRLPEKFFPNTTFLEYHRENIFSD